MMGGRFSRTFRGHPLRAGDRASLALMGVGALGPVQRRFGRLDPLQRCSLWCQVAKL
jgi:hypothetical protein